MKCILTAVTLVIALAAPLCAGNTAVPGGTPKASVPKHETVEKTGTIVVSRIDPRQKSDSIQLKVGAETFNLIPDKEFRKEFLSFSKLDGKEVTVRGQLWLPDAKHREPAIKVQGFKETGVGAK